jgi:hypothetical protein
MLALALAGGAPAAQPVPTPIGSGPAYHPRPLGPLARSVRCVGTGRPALRVHLELFANRRVVVVPTGIGVAGPRAVRFGRIRAARCHAALWTLDPTGVVYAARRGLTLGDLFRVWGQSLGPCRLLGFRGRVALFRAGRRLRADPRTVVLSDGDELVLEVRGVVRPHRSYLFPPDETGGAIWTGASKGP